MSKCPVCGNPGAYGCMGAPATPQVGLPIADEISAMFNLPPYPTPTRGAEQVAKRIMHEWGLSVAPEQMAAIIQAAIDEAVGEMRVSLEGVTFSDMGTLSPLQAAQAAKQIMLGAFDAANSPKEEK